MRVRVSKAVLLGLLAIVAGGCGEPTEVALPLLVVAGPNDLSSFEVRDHEGQAIWRLESDSPNTLDFIIYGAVPDGFHQTMPRRGRPRPLEPGEDLELESRNSTRAFVHSGYADTQATVVILGHEMHRLTRGAEQREPSSREVTP